MIGLAPLLAEICELEPPELVLDGLPTDGRLLRLIELGALVPIGARESVTCFACDEPHEALIEHKGKGAYTYYCPEAGEISVDSRLLQRYCVSMPWLAAQVSIGLNRPASVEHLTLPIPILRQVGEFRFRHSRCLLYVARRQFLRQWWEQTQTEVRRSRGDLPTIILTTTPMALLPSAPIGGIGTVPLVDVLTFDDGKPVVREQPLLSILGGDQGQTADAGLAFFASPDYRTVTSQGIKYEFTQMQAAAIRILDTARKGSHPRIRQSLIQERISTTQRMGQLFRGHTAYGKLIKHDGNGEYWIDENFD